MANRIEIRLSGAGGDGLLTAGKILGAAAVIYDEKHATQSQSYGPEARGGACRSEVIISDEDIEYPKATSLDVLLALTQEAIDRYAADVKPTGIVIVDADHVQRVPDGGYAVYRLPIKAKARDELGAPAGASIVALGALLALRPVVTRDGLENAVLLHVPKGTEELNKKALELGYELGALAKKG
jgi:2-oxoglutarate ferredoxin oxidoreductase subunit gamma